jgi:hypothetical protein
MEKENLVVPSRQCFSTPAGVGKVFLSKEQCDNTGASPILFNLASADLSVPSTEINIEGTELL